MQVVFKPPYRPSVASGSSSSSMSATGSSTASLSSVAASPLSPHSHGGSPPLSPQQLLLLACEIPLHILREFSVLLTRHFFLSSSSSSSSTASMNSSGTGGGVARGTSASSSSGTASNSSSTNMITNISLKKDGASGLEATAVLALQNAFESTQFAPYRRALKSVVREIISFGSNTTPTSTGSGSMPTLLSLFLYSVHDNVLDLITVNRVSLLIKAFEACKAA